MTRQHLTAPDGTALSCRMIGDGSAILLLHGFTMWCEMWWANGVVDRLEEHCGMIVPDARGHGDSGKPTDPVQYGRNMIDDIERVLDHAAAPKAHLVGFSMGAEAGLVLAASAPDRVASLLMIGSGWSGPEAIEDYRMFARWARENRLIMDPAPDVDAMDALAEGSGGHVDLPRGSLTELKMPCHGIAGSEDPELANLEKLKGVLKNYTLDVLHGETHQTSWCHPGIPERIEKFLAGVGALG